MHVLEWNYMKILIKISLKFAPRDPINNIPSLVHAFYSKNAFENVCKTVAILSWPQCVSSTQRNNFTENLIKI